MSTNKPTQDFNIYKALHTRYAAPEYRVYTEVTIGDRRADMVAVGLWASRGFPIVGIEIKQSRSDWLRELRDPAKMEKLWRHCSAVYLAVSDADIVKDDLPDGWGLLVPKGNSMVTKRKPAERVPETGQGFWRRLLQHDLESRNREVMAALAEQRRSLVASLESEELTKLRKELDRQKQNISLMDQAHRNDLDHINELRSVQDWMQGLSGYERESAIGAVKVLMKTHWWRPNRHGENRIDGLARTINSELASVASNISMIQDLMLGGGSCGSIGEKPCCDARFHATARIDD
jgi:hypothetical protein